MPDTTPADADEPTVRPFAATLLEIGNGKTHDDLSERLRAVIEGVETTGKAGALVLKLDIKPAAKGDTSVVTVAATVTAKVPAVDAKPSLFFVSDGNLSRSDPRQLPLPLREVPNTNKPIRSIAK